MAVHNLDPRAQETEACGSLLVPGQSKQQTKRLCVKQIKIIFPWA